MNKHSPSNRQVSNPIEKLLQRKGQPFEQLIRNSFDRIERCHSCILIIKNYFYPNQQIMYYILFYKTVDDYIEKRAPYRDEHLALVQDFYEKGHMVMAGALAEPADGAVLIFKGEDTSAAESFVEKDPYVKNGLISHWETRPWTVVVGGE